MVPLSNNNYMNASYIEVICGAELKAKGGGGGGRADRIREIPCVLNLFIRSSQISMLGYDSKSN